VNAAINIDEVRLGAKYRDSITRCEGVCTARIQYINGCVQASITWGKDGEPKSEWFDFDRLELVAEPVEEPLARRTGGPTPTTTMPRG
jgi:hypothetical protein